MIHSPFQALRGWLRLSEPRPAMPDADLPPGIGTTRLGDILLLREAWRTVEGFRQPDWRQIGDFIRGRTTDEAERMAMWRDASLQRLRILRQDLGGSDYGVVESPYFLLFSAHSRFAARALVRACDAIVLQLRTRLREAAWHWTYGKCVLVILDEEEAYDRYTSQFFPTDGSAYVMSGSALRKPVFRYTTLLKSQGDRYSLARELVHLCLSHLASAPLWLREGLASYLAGELTDPRSRQFDLESAKAQPSFWTPATIQNFWSGEAFCDDEARQMACNLAEIFVGMMWRELGDLVPFLLAAQRADGGESAAREHLGLSLGEVAAAVLGEGDWQPRPPARPSDTPPATARW